MTPKLFVRALLALLWVSVFCPVQEISVAAAADLQFAFPDITARNRIKTRWERLPLNLVLEYQGNLTPRTTRRTRWAMR